MVVHTSKKFKTVGIIGGGFSGVAVASHLVAHATIPFKIVIIEKNQPIGPGIAFGTQESIHPLNVVTENMGLYSKNPYGFYKWLQDHESTWRGEDPKFANMEIKTLQYLPRKLYGAYLKDTLTKIQKLARKQKISLEIIHDEAVDIENGFTITTASDQKIQADYIVLAIGVPYNKSFAFENDILLANPNYIRSVWQEKVNISSNSTVTILGTGLTTVDVLWTLKASGFNGHIYAISRSGQFPQSHLTVESKSLPSLNLKLHKECLTLFRNWKKEWAIHQTAGLDWRMLIDALRPMTTQLWEHMDIKSKKQFLRHLHSMWNRHRHRMSPDSGRLIEQLFENKQLQIRKGRILSVTEIENGQLETQFLSPAKGKPEKIFSDYVINCTGPEYKFDKRQDQLVHSLLNRKLIVSDHLGLGLKVHSKEQLAGDNNGKIFALGSLLFGEKFETTSVPDIREQAASIAQTIISCLAGESS